MIIVATFIAFGLAMGGMALGVMLGRRPLSGACGAGERCCREAGRCRRADGRAGGPDIQGPGTAGSDSESRAAATGVRR